MTVRRPLAAVALALAACLSAGPTAAADVDPDDGFSLTVTVLPSGSSPSPSPSPSSDAGSGRGGGSGSDDGQGETPADDGAEPGETGIGGLLYVSGVTTRPVWSWHTLGLGVVASITVRNASERKLDPRVRFWMDNVFGGRLSSPAGVTVAGLAPGERRVVEMMLDGGGQWTVVHVSAQVTPPSGVAADAAPLVRDVWAFLLPWIVVVLLVLVAAGLVIRRIVRAASAPAPADAASGAPA